MLYFFISQSFYLFSPSYRPFSFFSSLPPSPPLHLSPVFLISIFLSCFISCQYCFFFTSFFFQFYLISIKSSLVPHWNVFRLFVIQQFYAVHSLSVLIIIKHTIKTLKLKVWRHGILLTLLQSYAYCHLLLTWSRCVASHVPQCIANWWHLKRAKFYITVYIFTAHYSMLKDAKVY